MKTRLHKKQQNCNKLLSAFSLAVAGLCGIFACSLGLMKDTYKSARAVSYDDEDYTVELSADEFNNSDFSQLYTFLNTYNSVDDGYGRNYLTVGFENPPAYNFYIYNDDGDGSLQWNSTIPCFRLQQNGDFEYWDNYDRPTDVVYSVYLKITQPYYQDFKSIIQSALGGDSSSSNALQEFVSIIVSGIGAFATGVASGVSDFASALFLKVENGAVVGLSTFGGIVAIFAGLALAVAITTKVYLWITSLGN